jgi:hypothetical protein
VGHRASTNVLSTNTIPPFEKGGVGGIYKKVGKASGAMSELQGAEIPLNPPLNKGGGWWGGFGSGDGRHSQSPL